MVASLRHRVLSVPAALLLAAATLPGPAAGAPAAPAAAPAAKARVLPVALTLSDNAVGQSAQVAYLLDSAVRASRRHKLADAVERFNPAGARARSEKLARGKDALAFGRRALDSLEPGSLESFDRALRAFEEGNLWETFEGLGQALVMRILARWTEDPVGTRREVAHLLAIAPKADFPETLVPPDLAAEIRRARDAVAIEPRFTLDVSTQPVAARVYVDGGYRGTAPVGVRGLVAGEHYLTLVAPGYQFVQKKVRAGPGSTATETLVTVDRARVYLTFLERMRAGFGTADEVTFARNLGRVAEVDELLVAGVRRGGGRLEVELHRIAVRDGHALAVASFELAENDPDLAAAVFKSTTRALARDEPRGAKGEPAPLRSGLRRFWEGLRGDNRTARIATGAAAGGLVAAGVVLGALAWAGERDLRAMTQVSARDKASSVFGKAVAGDVLLGTGLVTGAVWAWLQFGRPHAAKTDIEAPDEAPGKRDDDREPERRRDDEEEDPFAARSPAPAGAVAPWVTAVARGGVLGVQGTW